MGAPTNVATLLPIWAVVMLIWLNGLMLAGMGALVLRMIQERATDAQITGARQAVEEQIRTNDTRYGQLRLTSDGRLDVLERELFGLDGDNGIRGNSKAMRGQVNAIMIVLRRLAESASIDTKEIDALNGD